MDIVVISSDSSAPGTPVTRSPNSINDVLEGQHSRSDKLVCKRPIIDFSSSDDSDPECSPNIGYKKFLSQPAVKKVDVDHFDNKDSDVEFCQIKETCTQEGYVPQQVKDICKDDLLDIDTLKKTDDLETLKFSKKCKTTKKKLLEEKREKRLKEKEEKMVEKAHEKALRKAASEAQKANRPGECMKYIQVLLDQRLLAEEYSGNLLSVLQAGQIKYIIQEQLSEKTITWVKTINNYHCDDNGKLIATTSLKEEDFVLRIMASNELVELVRATRLRDHIQSIAKQHVKKRLIIVIYRLEEFYKLQSTEKKQKFKALCRSGSSGNQRNVAGQEVCQSDIEKALIEIQIFENCSHRFVETSQDLGTLIAQFTKSLAEREFKLEKQQKEQEKLGWFASGDSRDTVKVDKSSNGLMRLWKQQLCQFNTASLDTAEAIASLYPSPKALIQAYENCSTQKEGQRLLQDIAIRRSAGPLTSVRKVGPELSKKIYNFFTSKNGDLSLSQD